jgi:hypothetical protein
MNENIEERIERERASIAEWLDKEASTFILELLRIATPKRKPTSTSRRTTSQTSAMPSSQCRNSGFVSCTAVLINKARRDYCNCFDSNAYVQRTNAATANRAPKRCSSKRTGCCF